MSSRSNPDRRVPAPRIVLALLHLTALAALGCGAPENDRGGDPERRFRTGSIEVVEAARSRYGPWDMADRRIWSVHQDAQPDDGTFWQRPVDVRVLGTRIFVLDDQAKEVVVLGRDGEFVSRTGGPGEGPGEMEAPETMERIGDRLIVLDRGRGQLSIFGPDGRPRGTFPLPSVPLDVFPAGDGRLALEFVEGRSQKFGLVQVADRDSAFFVDADTPPLGEIKDADREHLVPPDGRPCVRWGGRGDYVTRFSCFEPVVDLYRSTGEVVRRIKIDEGPVRTPSGVLDSIRSEVETRVRSVDLPPDRAEQLIERTVAGHRYQRRFREVRFDPSGTRMYLWEQRPLWSRDDASARLHVFSVGGSYLGVLRFSSRWDDFDVGDDHVYAVTVDPDTGLKSITAWRLPDGVAPMDDANGEVVEYDGG